MTTISFRKQDVVQKWHLVNAEGQVLGRLAAQVATVLRGKHKPMYTPNADTGDFVIVINAEKIVLTGNKWTQKTYYHHTGWPGGIRSTTAGKQRREKPERVIEYAILGMLPKTKLGRAMGKKLKVYAGDRHPHRAQNPEAFALKRRENS